MNQTREEFRLMAYGQFAYSRRSETLTKKEMDLFVEGALFAYDIAQRNAFKFKGSSGTYTLSASLLTSDTHNEEIK